MINIIDKAAMALVVCALILGPFLLLRAVFYIFMSAPAPTFVVLAISYALLLFYNEAD